MHYCHHTQIRRWHLYNENDLQAYFNGISRVSILCKQLDPINPLNSSKTQEMILCNKWDKPDSTALELDGREINSVPGSFNW